MPINFNGNVSVAGSNLVIGGIIPEPPSVPAPVINSVVISNSPMIVGDVVGVTINVDNDNGDLYKNLIGNIAGFPLVGLARVNNSTYTAQFTVTEGGTDVPAINDITVFLTLDSSTGETSSLYNSPVIQNNDPIDANSPVITDVNIPNVPMEVDDTVVATITVVTDNGDTYTNISGTIASYPLTNLTRVNSITYTAEFTITSGGVDIPAIDDIPTSLTIEDSLGNVSNLFNTPIVQPNDPITVTPPPIPLWVEDDTVSGTFNSIAISGDGTTLALGKTGPQQVDIYVDSGGTWVFQQAVSTATSGSFGYDVALSFDGDTLAVGGPSSFGNGTYDGAVFVYTRSGTTWTEQQTLLQNPSGGAGDSLGWTVAINGYGNRIAAGAFSYDQPLTQSGIVHVYDFTGTWNHTVQIQPTTPISGSNFGHDVALSFTGDTMIVGAPTESSGQGAAYVFQYTGSWSQEQRLTASDALPGHQFGSVVDINGNATVIAVSSPSNVRGKVYTFTNSGTWIEQQAIDGSDTNVNDKFGFHLDLSDDGSQLLVGAILHDDTLSNQGAIYYLTGSNGIFTEQQKIIPANAGNNYQFGRWVTVDDAGTKFVSYNNTDAVTFEIPTVAPPAGAYTDNTFWVSGSIGGINELLWTGTEWLGQDGSFNNELFTITGGPNDGWEDGFTPANIELVIRSVDNGGAQPDNNCYIQVMDTAFNTLIFYEHIFSAFDVDETVVLPLTFSGNDLYLLGFSSNLYAPIFAISSIDFDV
jgi:hypothetical protein